MKVTSPQIKYKGVRMNSVSKAESPNYLFIDLEIAKNTKSCTPSCNIQLKIKNLEFSISFNEPMPIRSRMLSRSFRG